MDEALQGIKALADKNRLKIIKMLLRKKYCVSALSEQLNISESAVSQQLKILREANLVRGLKEGYYVHYEVKPQELKNIGKYIMELEENQKNKECCSD